MSGEDELNMSKEDELLRSLYFLSGLEPVEGDQAKDDQIKALLKNLADEPRKLCEKEKACDYQYCKIASDLDPEDVHKLYMLVTHWGRERNALQRQLLGEHYVAQYNLDKAKYSLDKVQTESQSLQTQLENKEAYVKLLHVRIGELQDYLDKEKLKSAALELQLQETVKLAHASDLLLQKAHASMVQIQSGKFSNDEGKGEGLD